MAYLTEPNLNFTNDLKIFRGKYTEIIEIEARNKVVDRKIYLAWDTGEIFIGNAVKKLVKYGGSNNNLSEEDIKKICENYTKVELDLIRKQLTTLSSENVAISNKILILTNDLKTAIEKFQTKTEDYVLDKIQEIIDNNEDLTYSKNTIDEKLATLESSIYKKTEINNLLEGYDTKESNKQRFMQILKGDELYQIYTNPQGNINGYFFAITDSNDTLAVFKQGHVYHLQQKPQGIEVTDVTIGVNGFATPVIDFKINNQTSSIVEVGTKFIIDKENMLFDITNKFNMKPGGAISFYIDDTPIDSSIPYDKNTVQVDYISEKLELGEYRYKLKGLDKRDNIIESEYKLTVKAPYFLGLLSSIENIATIENSTLDNFTKVPFGQLSGDHQFVGSDKKNIWILIPVEEYKIFPRIQINKDEENQNVNFYTPIIYLGKKIFSINNMLVEYKCYKTASTIGIDSVVMTIE